MSHQTQRMGMYSWFRNSPEKIVHLVGQEWSTMWSVLELPLIVLGDLKGVWEVHGLAGPAMTVYNSIFPSPVVPTLSRP